MSFRKKIAVLVLSWGQLALLVEYWVRGIRLGCQCRDPRGKHRWPDIQTPGRDVRRCAPNAKHLAGDNRSPAIHATPRSWSCAASLLTQEIRSREDTVAPFPHGIASRSALPAVHCRRANKPVDGHLPVHLCGSLFNKHRYSFISRSRSLRCQFAPKFPRPEFLRWRFPH